MGLATGGLPGAAGAAAVGLSMARGLRLTYREAIERGILRPEDQPEAARSSAPAVGTAPELPVCCVDGDTPQQMLWRALCQRYCERVRAGDLVWELANVVPGRKFRLDMAFRRPLLAIEVDGWANHGKSLAGFRRDREKDRMLVVAGWRVLRFAAGEIRQDVSIPVSYIAAALATIEGEDSA